MNTQHWIRRGRLAACLSSSSRSRSVADVVAASGQRRVNAIDVCSSSAERSSSTKRSSSAAPSSRRWAPTAVLIGAVLAVGALQATLNGLAAEEPAALPKAFVDGTGTGWRALGKDDFTQVNTADNTWTWKPDGSVHCTGQPVGVIRTVKKYTNLELVAEWRHLKAAGNSGIFLWALDEPLMSLKPGQLPHGIEVQVLDLGYKEQYEKSSGKKADWFTTHGDVFPVGAAKMTPFPPTAPRGSRAFPKKELSKGVNEWNHYYVRAINGEVRLWVNGEEVTGGTACDPRTGYLCLESEGSPVEFRNLRIRELP